jgi:chitinase
VYSTNNYRTVGVCHATGNASRPFVYIQVPEEALAAHQGHGDIVGVSSAQSCQQQAAVTGSSNGSIGVGDAVCREGESCTFMLWQSRGTGSASVTFTTEDVSATGGASCTPGIDYVRNSGTMSVGAASTAALSVQTCTDNLTGPDERFRVRLTNTSTGQIKDGSGRGVLLETSVATMGANTVLATADMVGNITVSWGSTGGIEHRVYFAVGGACVFGSEFRRFEPSVTQGMLTGLAPNTLYCLQVRRLEFNGTETVLTATGPTSVQGSPTVGTVSIANATCVEGTQCVFTVTQTGGTTSSMVTYSTATSTASGGSCGLGADFQQIAGTLTVSPGIPATITVQTCLDSVPDANETFFVVLSPTSGVTITQGTAMGTITGS